MDFNLVRVGDGWRKNFCSYSRLCGHHSGKTCSGNISGRSTLFSMFQRGAFFHKAVSKSGAEKWWAFSFLSTLTKQLKVSLFYIKFNFHMHNKVNECLPHYIISVGPLCQELLACLPASSSSSSSSHPIYCFLPGQKANNINQESIFRWLGRRYRQSQVGAICHKVWEMSWLKIPHCKRWPRAKARRRHLLLYLYQLLHGQNVCVLLKWKCGGCCTVVVGSIDSFHIVCVLLFYSICVYGWKKHRQIKEYIHTWSGRVL